ncbi:hypothetical protein V1511DRAFT_500269 [Dipodascopsis uninucleata]
MATTIKTIKRVAVIGAGASGLVGAKALLEENAFSKIRIFERNGKAGGVWQYTGDYHGSYSIPSLDPNTKLDPQSTNGFKTWPTPAYDQLTTNIPWEIMTYRNKNFNRDLPFFAFRQDVADFLQSYADTMDELISYNTSVLDVSKNGDEWVVRYQLNKNGSPVEEERYDAVMVATGFFHVPYIPDVKNIKEYSEKYPGVIKHAKYFRKPEEFDGQTVLVVGAGASGMDISNQLAENHAKKVYKSTRSTTTPLPAELPDIVEVDIIESFNTDDKSIRLADGTVLTDIDSVIYATGYIRSLPFLSSVNKSSNPLITDGSYIHNLYLHCIYTEDPTLIIMGVQRFVLPFRTSQAQACYIARVWSGRLKLPPKPIMEQFIAKRFLEVGHSKDFHDTKFPDDSDYCEYALALCKLAPGEYGMFPRDWPRKERLLRSNIFKLKIAYNRFYEREGRNAKYVEELLKSGVTDDLGLETEVTDTCYDRFGKPINGDQYTEKDVQEAINLVKSVDYK